MEENYAKALLAKYAAGECTVEEMAIVESWYLQQQHGDVQDLEANERTSDMDEIRKSLQKEIQNDKLKVRRLWPRITAAASIAIIFGVGTYFLVNRRNETTVIANDIAPYSAAAILKSGGKVILLDKTANGKIAKTLVTKSSGEQLTYERESKTFTAVYDTIQIPAGGRPYTVKLTDGSKITLNAATTLRYPEAFSKNRSEDVELINGEIYAEVVHNANAPLRIKAPGQVITDIGTEFNIAAYADEPDSRTTLVEGGIKVTAAGIEKTLLPGSQAIITTHSLNNTFVNLLQVTAWKNGLFRFNGEHIDAVMRQLSRWYNIDVKYEGKVTDEVFYGRVARKRNISEVLRILERSNKVYFKVEGRRVTVLSKS
jgi:transmembrane sensor